MTFTTEEIEANIESLETVLAIPCPEGLERVISFTERQARMTLGALRVVLGVHESADPDEERPGTGMASDDLAELLDEHGFGKALQAIHNNWPQDDEA